MVQLEKSFEIKAPPEKVWEMLALDRMPEWMKELKSVNYISEVHTPEDKYRVGASARIEMKSSLEKGHDVEITESLEKEKMTYRSKPPYYTYVATYFLKPVEGGTKLTWTSDSEMPWGILGKALGKLFIERMSAKEIEKSFQNLISILEK